MVNISGQLRASYALYGPATAYAPAGWDGSQLPLNGVVFSDAKDGAVFFYAQVDGVQHSGSGLLPRSFAFDGEIYSYTLNWDNVVGQATVTVKGVTYGPIAAPVLPANALSLILLDDGTGGNFTVLPKGTLAIDTTPVKGEVFIKGVSYGMAPVPPVELDVGFYTISFGAVDKHATPEPVTVEVSEGMLTQVTAEYVLITTPPMTTVQKILIGLGAAASLGLGIIAFRPKKPKK